MKPMATYIQDIPPDPAPWTPGEKIFVAISYAACALFLGIGFFPCLFG
jgi:hypothetical protein